jgi:predicted MFS family arabinose efflux permease
MAQGVGVLCGALIGGRLYDNFSVVRHVSHISPFYASAILLTIATLLSFVLIPASPERDFAKREGNSGSNVRNTQ